MKKHYIHTFFYDLEQTSRICRAFCEINMKQNSAYGLTLDEFIILETVLCNENLCQRDLAKLILKGASHTAKILNKLEKSKFIERPIDKKNNRLIRKIVITELGTKAFNDAKKCTMNYVKHLESYINNNDITACHKTFKNIKNALNFDENILFE